MDLSDLQKRVLLLAIQEPDDEDQVRLSNARLHGVEAKKKASLVVGLGPVLAEGQEAEDAVRGLEEGGYIEFTAAEAGPDLLYTLTPDGRRVAEELRERRSP